MPKINVCYYYKKKFVDFNMKNRHSHEAMEIMYVSSGECVVATPYGKKMLHTGQFIILGSRFPHALKVGRADIANLEFTVGGREGFEAEEVCNITGVRDVLETDCRVFTDDGSVYSALRDVIREMQTVSDPFAVKILMNRLFIALGRICDQTGQNAGGNIYVKRAQTYIVHNCDEKLKAEDVAKEVGINVSYLQSLFRKCANTTITEYANRVRIEKAVFLLRNSSLDITEIAIECGFSSRQHFGLIFRNVMGCSPMNFRKSK